MPTSGSSTGAPVSATYYGYSSGSNVAAYCQNLLGPAANFTTSTSPTLTEVESWLSSGCGIINGRLAARGWATPVSANTAAGDWIRDLNTLYGAARAEMSRTNITISPGERTRGMVFDKLFKDGLLELLSVDLSMIGVSKSTGGAHVFVGGTSIANKDTVEADSDRVKPRFFRGMHKFAGTIDPGDDTNDD